MITIVKFPFSDKALEIVYFQYRKFDINNSVFKVF